MKISVIYKITSITNDKFYVGSAVNFSRRANKHRTLLKNNKHDNPKMQAHVNKYGLDDLVFSILETVDDPQIIIQREQFYIDSLNPDFNLCLVAGNCLGKKHSEATRLKMSLAKKGKKPNNYGTKHSVESKIKIGLWNKGRKDSEEVKARKSQAQRDKPSCRRYKRGPQSQEHKKNLAEALKGRTPWNKGKPMAEDSKKKLSESLKGKPAWNRGRQRTSEENQIFIGKKRSEESKKRMSDSRKAYLLKQNQLAC